LTVDDSSDLRVSDALQAAEHHNCSLEFWQLVVSGDDDTELVGNALYPVSLGRFGRLRRTQESMDGELPQICG
jgi:hypothetical protein